MWGTRTSTKVITICSFLVMVIASIFANYISINGKTTYQILNSYPNLLAPAGYTYYIWVPIYLLLVGFMFYQLGMLKQNKGSLEPETIQRIRILFMVSTILNAVWLLTFHYDFMALALALAVIIFICILYINRTIATGELSMRDKLLVRLPFSVFFGWITVYFIITGTILFVSIGWQGFGISDLIWTIIIIIMGTTISLAIMLKYKDIAYGLTVIWTYTGILVKHLSASGFRGQYPEIILSAIICIAILAIAVGYLFFLNRRKLY